MEKLIELVYISRASEQFSERDIGKILTASKRYNPPRQVGGALFYSQGCFLQCLEGGQSHVNDIYAKILQDGRHRDLEILWVREISKRRFANWSMKYALVEAQVMKLLKRRGLSTFDPYQLDDALIDQLLELFSQSSRTQAEADQAYPVNGRPHGFLARLLRPKAHGVPASH
jgi:hypothetical protein